jgi:PAS domain S-box-containing protein
MGRGVSKGVAPLLAAAHVDAAGLIETIHAVVLVLDRKGCIVYFNSHLAEISGHSLDSMRGKNWFTTFIPRGDRKQLRRIFAQTLEAGSLHSHVNPILVSDGSLRHIEWYAETLRDDGGEIAGAIAVGHDITDRLSAERRLRELEAEKQRRDRLADIGAITAKLVHDLGNPLAAVSMQAQLILRRARRGDFQPAEAVEKPVERILLTVRRLEELVREFADFTREQRLQLRQVPLEPLLQGIADLWRDYAASQGVDISTALPGQAPVIRADEAMLRRVLDNVVKNAIEAQIHGGCIVLRAANVGAGRVRIDVADEGSGIPAGLDAFRLFETTKEHGTGIGLAVARQLIGAHDGTIDHAPNEPRGTVFRIDLPITGPDYPELEVAPR